MPILFEDGTPTFAADMQAIPQYPPTTLRSELDALATGFLATQATIRVVCNPGGGVGNYKASFSVMRQLRDLGFSGVIDLCFHCVPKFPTESFSRLQLFLPQAIQQSTVQHLEDPELGEILFRNLPYQDTAHDLPFVQVAITGADHCFKGHPHLSTPKTILYNVGQYIQLNPSGWPTVNTVDFFTLDKTIALPPEGTLTSIAPVALQSDTLLNPELAFTFRQLLPHPSASTNTRPFILTYGLSHDPDDTWICPALELSRLVSALTFAIPDRPAIIIVPYTFSKIRCSDVTLSAQADIYTEHNFSALSARLQKPLSGKSLLVFTGSLPETYFDALAKHAWLVVAEGCNLIAQREAAGLPYLHGGRQLTELSSLSSKAPRTLLDLERLHHHANHYLEAAHSSNHKALVTFLSLLHRNDTDMATYFAHRRQMYAGKPDLVVTSLAIIATIQTETVQLAFLRQLLQLLLTQHQEKKLTRSCECYHTNASLTRLKWLHLANPNETTWRAYYFYFLAIFTHHYIEKAQYNKKKSPTLFASEYLPAIIHDYVYDADHHAPFSSWATAQHHAKESTTPASATPARPAEIDRPASPFAMTALWDHLRFTTPVISSTTVFALPTSGLDTVANEVILPPNTLKTIFIR